MDQKELDKKLLASARDGRLKTVKALLADGAKLCCRNRDDNSPLMLAVRNRHEEVIDFLISEHKANNESHKKSLLDAFMIAIDNNHLDLCQKLLNTGISIDGYKTQYSAFSPLELAIEKRNVPIVEWLLQQGANPNHHLSDHYSILSNAILTKNRNVDIIELLLKAGADINRQEIDTPSNFRGERQTPLNLATHYKSTDIIYILLEDQYHGMFSKNDLNQALLLAIEKENLPLVTKIVEKGADLNTSIPLKNNSWNNTYPLLSAIEKGFYPVFQYLLQKDASLLDNENLHQSFLSSAIRSGNANILSALLDHGLNPNEINSTSNMPFLFVACILNNSDTVKTLVDHGANIHIKNYHGNSPLHTACMHGKTDTVAFLIDQSANIHEKGELNLTPLQLAIINNHFDIAQYLYSKGATDINTPLHDTTTLLMSAVSKLTPEQTEIVLGWGADIDAEDNTGKTALMHACENFQTEHLAVLVNHGANINHRDHLGNTALNIACQGHDIYIPLIESLLEYGANPNIVNNKGDNVLSVITNHHLTTKNIAALNKILDAPLDDNEQTHAKLSELLNKLASSTFDNSVIAMTKVLTLSPNVNIQDDTGFTPLMRAIQNQSLDKIKHLIESGADINIISHPEKGTALNQVNHEEYTKHEIKQFISCAYEQQKLEKSIDASNPNQNNFSF